MIYVAKCKEDNGLFKVGYSAEPNGRIKGFSHKCSSLFEVVEVFPYYGGARYGPEGRIHAALIKHKAKGLQKQFGREVYSTTFEVIRAAIVAEIERYDMAEKESDVKRAEEARLKENVKFMAIDDADNVFRFMTQEEMLDYANKNRDEYIFYAVTRISIKYVCIFNDDNQKE